MRLRDEPPCVGRGSVLLISNNASAPWQEDPDAPGPADDDAGRARREGEPVPWLSRPSGDWSTRSVGDDPCEDRQGPASANREPVQVAPRRRGHMAVKKIKVNGRWVWQARVAYKGLRKSTIRETKDDARTAEAGLLQELKAKVGQAAEQAEAPATL